MSDVLRMRDKRAPSQTLRERLLDRSEAWDEIRSGRQEPPSELMRAAARRRDPELVSTPPDKHMGGLPRESSSRASGAGPRRPMLWADVEAQHQDEPEPVYGAFPRGFVMWLVKLLGCGPREVLHVCSGMLTAEEVGGGVRVDVRPAARPDVVADGRALPFPDASFSGVTIDPPYSVEYAEELYGTEYPRPSHLLREAARVVRPCGRIAFVHYLVPSPPPGCRIVGVRGVTQGCGYRIRAVTIFEREQDALPGLTP